MLDHFLAVRHDHRFEHRAGQKLESDLYAFLLPSSIIWSQLWYDFRSQDSEHASASDQSPNHLREESFPCVKIVLGREDHFAVANHEDDPSLEELLLVLVEQSALLKLVFHSLQESQLEGLNQAEFVG